MRRTFHHLNPLRRFSCRGLWRRWMRSPSVFDALRAAVAAYRAPSSRPRTSTVVPTGVRLVIVGEVRP